MARAVQAVPQVDVFEEAHPRIEAAGRQEGRSSDQPEAAAKRDGFSARVLMGPVMQQIFMAGAGVFPRGLFRERAEQSAEFRPAGEEVHRTLQQ